MAVTKIHPIKSTLKKALDYIENPAKTDEKMLVSSFACAYETADIEFELLLSQAMQKGNNLAHHLIQSFAPGETTPEQAHEIGRQLADEVLQGKYPYVLTTHIDKGHVHNHVIFCAVDMVNQRKYVSNRQSYSYIRRTSDRLCKEHGLSVVMPGQDRGKSYAEWDAHRKGTSWKAKLKAAIDAAIPQAKDFDDFLRLLQEQGYEVKRGKYVSFRAPGQERFTRCKTLGEAYTEEAITERIKGRSVERKPKENHKISLRIDLENSIKVQQSAGYEKWAKLHNPPFDALGDGFFGVGFAQRFAAGEPFLSGRTERYILAPLDFIALLLQEPQKIVKILGLRDGCIYGGFQLRLPARALAVCIPLGIAFASVLTGHHHRQTMFLAQPVAGAPDVGIALPVRNIFALIHHVHSAKDDVVVDVPFVNVGGQHIGIFSLQDFICKLPANFVGLLRRGFARRKRLYQVVGQIVAFLHGL